MSTPISADTLGYIGFSYGNNQAINESESNDELGTSLQIDGAYAFAVGQNTVVVEGSYRTDDYVSKMIGESSFDPQTQIGAHYLYGLNNGATVGAFAAYGTAPHGADNLAYQAFFGGIEGILPVGKNTVLFAQAAYGDALALSTDHPGGTMESAGFHEGYVIRAGVTVAAFGSTRITLEGEIGASVEYESSDEPGEFYTVAISGLTPISSNGAWVASYGARHAFFAAEPDPDTVAETSYNIGIRYMFGGSSSDAMLNAGMIGLPYLPLRASAWVPEIH